MGVVVVAFLSVLGATAVSESNSGKMTRIDFYFFAVDSDSEGNAGIFIQGINRDHQSQEDSGLSPSDPFIWGFPGGLVVKNLPAHAGDLRRGFDLSQEDALEEEVATSVLPGKSHGQRSLAGYSP